MPIQYSRHGSDPYSRHGSEKCQDKFTIYHQGGLDNYCQLYSIFNLINFITFKKSQNDDFLGKNEYCEFLRIRNSPNFRNFFPEIPFGDLHGIDVKGALDEALERARLEWKTNVEEDETIPLDDKSQKDRWLRIGIEKAFAQPDAVLGLVQVHEDKYDYDQLVGHCVVLIGRNHLINTEIDHENFDGIVLDSIRDYNYWRYDQISHQVTIARLDKVERPTYWISSFVSCFPAK